MAVELGQDLETQEPVYLTDEARRRGVYVIGTTGTGKTSLLKEIARQDMEAGDGLCVLDPHGDMIDELLELVPPKRADDVILFAPGDDQQTERPLGLNLLAWDRKDTRQKRRVASTIIDTLRKLYWYSWGPRMEDLLRVSIHTLMEKKDTTFLDLWLLLVSKEKRHRYLQHVDDPYSRTYWYDQFEQYTPRDIVEITGSSLNKLGRFLADPHLRNVIAQPRNAFDMRQIMDHRQILLVNLSKGELGEDNSALLGAVLVNQILVAALTRRYQPPEDRILFHLIVDEYQNFATEAFPTLQSEARKYNITLITAHQYRDQLDALNKGSTLNVANLIVLRVSGLDGQDLALQFDITPPPADWEWEAVRTELTEYPGLHKRENIDRRVPGRQRLYADMAAERANELARLDNFVARCRLVGDDRRLRDYSVQLNKPRQGTNKKGADHIRAESLKRGVPRENVERAIEKLIGDVARPPWLFGPIVDDAYE